MFLSIPEFRIRVEIDRIRLDKLRLWIFSIFNNRFIILISFLSGTTIKGEEGGYGLSGGTTKKSNFLADQCWSLSVYLSLSLSLSYTHFVSFCLFLCVYLFHSLFLTLSLFSCLSISLLVSLSPCARALFLSLSVSVALFTSLSLSVYLTYLLLTRTHTLTRRCVCSRKRLLACQLIVLADRLMDEWIYLLIYHSPYLSPIKSLYMYHMVAQNTLRTHER